MTASRATTPAGEIVTRPMRRAVVTGAGGFIGGHLVRRLEREGVVVRAVDTKPTAEWQQRSDTAENCILDVGTDAGAMGAVDGVDTVFNLAADMGGIGFIEKNRARCMLSVLTSVHMLRAAERLGVERYFYSSSACVYAAVHQDRPDVVGLREEDAYPAMPEEGYGWEKLFSERLCRQFEADFGLATRVARYHNVYGPEGTFEGGREKAPAALCRKIAAAKLCGSPVLEVWGDGRQTRSFTYIDDCIEGTLRIVASDVAEPLNLGSDQLVSIDRLVDILEGIAGVRLERRYITDAAQGVRGRNSDNTRINDLLGWAPSIRLEVGLERTYRWVYDQLAARSGG